MSYTKCYYHIVLRTKRSERTIPTEYKRKLFAYMLGFITNAHATLIRINGIEDHIHLLVAIPPSLSLSDFVKELKVSSSKWLKLQAEFPNFAGWGEGYAALTCGTDGIEPIRQYIINQEEHHRVCTFKEEYEAMITEMGYTIDERHWRA